jgi:hypothetical protein
VDDVLEAFMEGRLLFRSTLYRKRPNFSRLSHRLAVGLKIVLKGTPFFFKRILLEGEIALLENSGISLGEPSLRQFVDASIGDVDVHGVAFALLTSIFNRAQVLHFLAVSLPIGLCEFGCLGDLASAEVVFEVEDIGVELFTSDHAGY